MVRTVAAILIVLVVTSASAADAPKPKAPEPGTSVEMPYLIAPVIVDGKLQANAYISSKVIASSQASAIEIRAKLAFVQDAYVRDVNAKPIGEVADPGTVDKAALRLRLLADAKRVMGGAPVTDVEITNIQMAEMRPGSTPP